MLKKYFRPKNLKETIDLLDKYKEQNPQLLAGGTDIMVKERDAYLDTSKPYIEPLIIDINANKNEIGKIELNKNDKSEQLIEIGALATYTDILESKLIADNVPIISKSAFAVGGKQIQNMGTIGGMLGTATPAADVVLAFLVMNVKIVLYSKKGYRTIPITDFFTGYRKTLRKPNEIIIKIITPIQNKNEKFDYIKVGGRKGQVIAISGFCARIVLEVDIIKNAFISVASASPYPIRLRKVEDYIKGISLNSLKNLKKEDKKYSELVKKIDNSISPIDEIVATAEYKRHCIKNLILDFLLSRV